MDNRKSRLPVRNSDCRRSSIARSRSVTDLRLLHVPAPQSVQCQKSVKRSRSLRRNTETPVTAFRRRSPFGRINQAQDIEDQCNRIKQNLKTKDPEIVSIKPSTIKDFLRITNVLMSQISTRYKFTVENYKTELPRILQMLQYPTKITQSLLKTPNTTHSFPVVLAIWSFILDMVDLSSGMAENSADVDIETQMKRCELKYVGKYYKNFCQNLDDDVDAINEAFTTEMLSICGTNKDAISIEAQKVDKLQHEVNGLIERKAGLQAKLENFREKNKKYRETIHTHNEEFVSIERKQAARKLKLNTRLLQIETTTREKMEERRQLREKITETGHSREEVEQMKTKIEDLRQSVQLGDERRAHLIELGAQLDMKQSEALRKIKSLVYSINNQLESYSLMRGEAKKLLLPMSGFFNMDFAEHIPRLGTALAECERKDEETDIALRRSITEREAALKAASEKLELVEKQFRETDYFFKKLNKAQETMNMQYKKLQSDEQKCSEDLECAQRDRLDLQPYLDALQRATEKRDRLLIKKEKHITKIQIFFLESNKAIVESFIKDYTRLTRTGNTLGVLQETLEFINADLHMLMAADKPQ